MNGFPWFDASSAINLSHTSLVVDRFLQTGRLEGGVFVMNIGVKILLSDGRHKRRSVERAIMVLEQTCPSLTWVRQARVKWLEIQLAEWAHRILQEDVQTDVLDAVHREATAKYNVIMHLFTQDDFKGPERAQLSDAYLTILNRLRSRSPGVEQSLRSHILHRTGCWMTGRKRGDLAACNRLLKKYGLPPE